MSKATTLKMKADQMEANVKAEIPRISSFEIIRNWINSNEKVSARCDESFILQNLAFSEFDIEKTKKRIAYYNHYRRVLPKWFIPEDENVARFYICEQHFFYIIPFQQDREVATVFFNLEKCDFHKYTINQCTNVIVSITESAIEDARYQLFGVELIFDFKNISFHTASHIKLNHLRKAINLLMNAAPLKLNKFHVINTPKIFNSFICKRTFLTNKIFGENMVINHGKDLTSLKRCISPKYFPFEYGGTAGSIEMFANQTMELWKKHTNH